MNIINSTPSRQQEILTTTFNSINSSLPMSYTLYHNNTLQDVSYNNIHQVSTKKHMPVAQLRVETDQILWILVRIFKEGFFGGFIVVMRFFYIFLTSIFIEHLNDSKIHLSAYFSATIYIFWIDSFITGTNQGFNIIIGRLLGKKDWKGIQKILWMQIYVIAAISAFL